MQVVIIFAVTNNYLKDIAVEDIHAFEQGLFDYITNYCPEILESINQTKDLTDENRQAIINAIESYKQKIVSTK